MTLAIIVAGVVTSLLIGRLVGAIEDDWYDHIA